ncbi:hypothetical protein [Neobacillus drentensis]|uniref:hypothetical protein n=1 Tax=Neobacillus drentensis TaxID=220684 RepID=UPI002FFEFBF0
MSKAPVSIRQLSEVPWGHDSENMSESYVPRMIKDIRTDIKTGTGIDGKELLKTESGKYIWNHQLLSGSIHYKQMITRRRGAG